MVLQQSNLKAIDRSRLAFFYFYFFGCSKPNRVTYFVFPECACYVHTLLFFKNNPVELVVQDMVLPPNQHTLRQQRHNR